MKYGFRYFYVFFARPDKSLQCLTPSHMFETIEKTILIELAKLPLPCYIKIMQFLSSLHPVLSFKVYLQQ